MDKELIYFVFCGSLNLIEKGFSRWSRPVLSCFVSERPHSVFLSKGSHAVSLHLPSLLGSQHFCANKINLKENNRENAFLFIYAASRSSYGLCIFSYKLLVDVDLNNLAASSESRYLQFVKTYFLVGLTLHFFKHPR